MPAHARSPRSSKSQPQPAPSRRPRVLKDTFSFTRAMVRVTPSRAWYARWLAGRAVAALAVGRVVKEVAIQKIVVDGGWVNLAPADLAQRDGVIAWASAVAVGEEVIVGAPARDVMDLYEGLMEDSDCRRWRDDARALMVTHAAAVDAVAKELDKKGKLAGSVVTRIAIAASPSLAGGVAAGSAQ